jgi:hypothetical protein
LVLVPAIVVVLGILRPAHWGYYLFGGLLGVAALFAASYVDFVRRRRHDTFITLEESLKRAIPRLPPLAQLDVSRAIVGVGTRGSLRSAYATIRVFKSDDGMVGSVQVMGGLLGTKFLFVAKEVPFEEFSNVLAEQGILVLPQSRYSDELAKSL